MIFGGASLGNMLTTSEPIIPIEVLVALSEPVNASVLVILAWSSKMQLKCINVPCVPSVCNLHLDLEFSASYECCSSGGAVVAGQRGESNNR